MLFKFPSSLNLCYECVIPLTLNQTLCYNNIQDKMRKYKNIHSFPSKDLASYHLQFSGDVYLVKRCIYEFITDLYWASLKEAEACKVERGLHCFHFTSRILMKYKNRVEFHDGNKANRLKSWCDSRMPHSLSTSRLLTLSTSCHCNYLDTGINTIITSQLYKRDLQNDGTKEEDRKEGGRVRGIQKHLCFKSSRNWFQITAYCLIVKNITLQNTILLECSKLFLPIW